MKKFMCTSFAIFGLVMFSAVGCGGHDQKVIQPAEDEKEMSASEQEDLDKGMAEQMNEKGN